MQWLLQTRTEDITCFGKQKQSLQQKKKKEKKKVGPLKDARVCYKHLALMLKNVGIVTAVTTVIITEFAITGESGTV